MFLPGSDFGGLLATKVDAVEVVSHLSVVVTAIFGVVVPQLTRVVLPEALHFALIEKRAPLILNIQQYAYFFKEKGPTTNTNLKSRIKRHTSKNTT